MVHIAVCIKSFFKVHAQLISRASYLVNGHYLNMFASCEGFHETVLMHRFILAFTPPMQKVSNLRHCLHCAEKCFNLIRVFLYDNTLH